MQPNSKQAKIPPKIQNFQIRPGSVNTTFSSVNSPLGSITKIEGLDGFNFRTKGKIETFQRSISATHTRPTPFSTA